MASRRKVECPVEAYATAVVSGDIVAGRLVRLACERHLRDLKEGPKRGLKWKPELANHALDFFSKLKLADGAFAGKPFTLQPFQQFIIGSIFGWVSADGFRRFRTAYAEIGKGNGKSPVAAGIGLYGMTADEEPGAECYAAATTRDQAGVLFRDATMIAGESEFLARLLEIGQRNIANEKTNSFFRPVSSEHRGLDGKRPHMALLDEIHEHPTAMVVDKMRAGTKNRRQALIFEITNSGVDRRSVCWAHHEYSRKILEGLIDDDSWFAFVCGLDACPKCAAEGHAQPVENCKECDQWDDEAVWLKANPGLGTILPHKYLREQVHEAKGMPTKMGIVKRLNFCIWTNSVTHMLPMDKWDSCRRHIDLAHLIGRPVHAALDIGSTSDFCALALLFPHDDVETIHYPIDPLKPELGMRAMPRRSFSLLTFFWLPEEPVRRDEHMTKVIEDWRRDGFVRTTPGEVVDYDEVLSDILELLEPYMLIDFAIDRGFQGAQIGNNLQKHFGELVFAFPQGIISMNAPTRELIELVKLKRIHHDGNPILRWMASNTAAEERSGLIKPSKDKSSEKIDGITALVMALGRALVAQMPDPLTVEVWG